MTPVSEEKEDVSSKRVLRQAQKASVNSKKCVFLPRDASAERGDEIACRLSVRLSACLSVTFRYRDHEQLLKETVELSESIIIMNSQLKENNSQLHRQLSDKYLSHWLVFISGFVQILG